ncbi:M28 family peptidase [Parasphingorhabdus sp.]|uniref:M28 family peptidase n=1 Tax=Parasphingorhabdus sp. TaxID=2709688 RepID=UPI0030015741
MRIIALLCVTGLAFSSAARSEPIAEADLLRHIEILASDAFEGREPGTLGENRTVNYIATQWAKTGLRPAGADGSWYAPVQLVERVPERYRMTVAHGPGGRPATLPQEEIILRSRAPSFEQRDMPLVFAGYADSDPGLSVSGKLVLLPLAPLAKGEHIPDFRSRKRQLMRDGAVGVIMVLEKPDQWPRYRRFFARGATGLSVVEDHAAIEGMISPDQFRAIVRQSGRDDRQLLADRDAIAVIDLDLLASAGAETRVRSYLSHNVIGRIAGTEPESGALLFLGHWDHFGICRAEDPQDPDKDRICNGAVDNASGLSLLIETAKRLSATPHDRDIYFLATTAEEKGLLGARAFVESPPVALEKLVVAFNADTIALSANATRIAVLGLGESGLDADIEIVAGQEGREIDRSGISDPYVRRQDGYVFLERDIPAYLITSAFTDQERLDAFINGPYHDVSDEVNDDLLLTGAAADANFHVALGRYFASAATYPGKATSGEADN